MNEVKEKIPYHIFLIGFMGTGKSTVATRMMTMLGIERVEMDDRIAEKAGMSIPEIFTKYGENYFRDLESRLLVEMHSDPQSIVSCGGGVVVREENTRYMKKKGRVVLLKATPETVYDRVKNSTERPILNNNMNVAFIKQLMEKRRERYEEVADITVETDNKDVNTVCEEIISKLLDMDRRNQK